MIFIFYIFFLFVKKVSKITAPFHALSGLVNIYDPFPCSIHNYWAVSLNSKRGLSWLNWPFFPTCSLKDVADYKSKGKIDGAKGAPKAPRKKMEEDDEDDEEDEEEEDDEEEEEDEWSCTIMWIS